jgi:alpha-mannosidase
MEPKLSAKASDPQLTTARLTPKASLCGRPLAAVVYLLFALALASNVDAQQTPEARAANEFSDQQTAAALKTLSTTSQAKVERLAELGSIPIKNWRLHVGDLAHGEAIDLDDSAWPSVQTPYQTDIRDVVWLRTRIQVPDNLHGYDLTGTKLWLEAWRDVDVTVFYNGRRVAGEGDLEPVLVFNSTRPGEEALVAVRIGRTDDTKFLIGRELHVDAAPTRPDPQDFYTQFVTAALLLPDLAGNLKNDRAQLEKAINDVDFEALAAKNQKQFDESLKRAQGDLEIIRPTLRKADFHLTGNSHIDAAWLWPWTETVDVVRRTFGTALRLMNEYPSYTYTQSALQYNEWMAEKYPEMNAEIKQRIQEGRWEVVGGMWVEPDLNMPAGESLVRQLLIGQRTLKGLYGVTTRIGWNPDSFGYNWQLPQIYKKSGMDYFVTQKLAWNETNPFPFKLFWWESPDGSKVLTYFPHSYANEDLDPVRLSNDFVKARSLAPGLPEMMDLFGVGDHGGGQTRAMLDQGERWMRPGSVVPEMQFGTAQAYFNQVQTKIASDSPVWNYKEIAKGVPALTPVADHISIPTWDDELYFEHHRGTYTTQADHKRNMRESENWLLTAEEYSSLAWLDGQPYPADELSDAWKKALFNQFHDLAAGSGIGIIYQDAQRDYRQVRWATDEAISHALGTIESRIDTRNTDGVPVVVFNSLAWPRSGVAEVSVQMPGPASDGVSVLDDQNHVLPSEATTSDPKTNTFSLLVMVHDVPSLGYQVVHVAPRKSAFATDLKASGTTLENAFVRLSVDSKNGCITSIYNKAAHFEAIAHGGCGNELQVFKDTPQADDAWNIDPGTLDTFTALTDADSVRLVEESPFRAVIRVTRSWHDSRFVQDIILHTGSDQVEVLNNIDWHETHTLLKAAFPLTVQNQSATYEIPFGTIERPTTRRNSWEQARFEVPALRWADLSDERSGFSLINESKYGYDCKDNVLRLTLLRSPAFPDPNADRGHHTFRYALYPHAGNWKSALTVRRGYEYNSQLTASQVQPHQGSLPQTHSFLQLDQENVVLTAVKKAEDSNGLIVRLYEWSGKEGYVNLHIPPGSTAATLTNLMEVPEGGSLERPNPDEVRVPVHPYSIVSLRIDYGKGGTQ